MKTGYHKARALFGALGFTSKGTEQVAVEFEITEGDCKGEHITWFGFFTDQTTDRTIESLRNCGWQGDDLSDLSGLGDLEVSLDVGEEEYEGKTHLRVKWVNAPRTGVTLKQAMTDAEAKAFAQRLKGAVIAQRSKSGAAPRQQSPQRSGQQTQRRGGAPPHAPDAPPPGDNDLW